MLVYNKSSITYPFNSARILKQFAQTLFALAIFGQLLFGIYVLGFYFSSALNGQFENWNKVLPAAYIKGDLLGNIIVGLHVLIGGIIIIGGPLQFIPSIRKKFKSLHKWIGRIYTFVSILVACAGLYMVWIRESFGDTFMHISISISALYLIVFAIASIRNAMHKNFIAHERWALRLFLIANGGWFFRIGFMAWININGGPVGFDVKTFSGPALWIISATSYSLPISIIILQMYLYAKKKNNPTLNSALTILLASCIVYIAYGIYSALTMAWIPRLM
ncbi:MAG: DUF2306 domain-containing protein [Chitinophagaceae bacterium]|jgi:hypothetical protein|nr:DUF2306 domain-containing protein [Chitinophagaceae bacterium]